jgi:hypothetical protein
MRSMSRLLSLVVGAIPLSGCGGSGGGGGGPPAEPPRTFVHVATPGSIVATRTLISHPLLDGDPTALILATQVTNPGGATTHVVNAHPIGVGYDSAEAKWFVVNEDLVPMTPGAAFFVRIVGASLVSFVHTADAANTSGNVTVLSNPLADGNADAVLLVSQHLNATGGAHYNPGEIGVFFNVLGNWAIFQQDSSAMPLGVDFVVRAFASSDRRLIVHSATAGTIGGASDERTYLSGPDYDGLTGLDVQVTQHWDPATGGVYNAHPFGMLYDHARDQWAIVNLDDSPMPVGATFNVWTPID